MHHTKHTLRDVILTNTHGIHIPLDRGCDSPERVLAHGTQGTGKNACKRARALFRSGARKLTLPCPWIWTLPPN